METPQEILDLVDLTDEQRAICFKVADLLEAVAEGDGDPYEMVGGAELTEKLVGLFVLEILELGPKSIPQLLDTALITGAGLAVLFQKPEVVVLEGEA